MPQRYTHGTPTLTIAGHAIAIPLYPASYLREKRDKRDTKLFVVDLLFLSGQ